MLENYAVRASRLLYMDSDSMDVIGQVGLIKVLLIWRDLIWQFYRYQSGNVKDLYTRYRHGQDPLQ